MSTFELDDIYCEFGFNFDSLRKSAMQDVLNAHHVPYVKRSTNAELAVLLEKHYAEMLLRRGQLPDEYLAPDFDPFTYTTTELRQVLSMHDLKYREKASRAELARLFDSHARTIRASRTYKQPQRSARMDDIAERLARSDIHDHSPNDAVPATGTRPGSYPPRSPLFADPSYSGTRQNNFTSRAEYPRRRDFHNPTPTPTPGPRYHAEDGERRDRERSRAERSAELRKNRLIHTIEAGQITAVQFIMADNNAKAAKVLEELATEFKYMVEED